ncbi:DUF4173 domain-containing protein [Hwanghaeella grinnelliae]|uniref:DUF4173 domain-containing protein n=1 Tax=Hwanghaeella grinnelliae TaxID=2500179 RepID=A0A437QNK5_9PROT|nr:DUF4173 domain-containing protein [Hwanghaeella grinnelliae]RVU36040.1 DUF4173 domain-containing protein [Hwanghaeella grinnelliae]
MPTAVTTKPFILPKPGIRRSFLLAGLMIAVADWLFYDRPLGISVIVAVTVVALGVVAGLSKPVPKRRIAIAVALLAASVLPILEYASTLSLFIVIMGIASFAILLNQDIPTRLEGLLFKSASLLTSGPFQLIRTVRQMKRAGRRAKCRHSMSQVILPWIMPIGLGLIFLLLFRLANPLIESWLASLVPDMTGNTIKAGRICFWAGALIAVWPFVRLKRSSAVFPATPVTTGFGQPVVGGRHADALFGTDTVIRSLAAFNALFLIQTGLDLFYLWGGTRLPIGMTHAEYAHRGAYPLVFTALLAGAVILFAMRPGSRTEGNPAVRKLVYLWTAQNVLLVMSSIFRLQLYVAEYALTYLRIAAFVWMGLVAAGLVLIVVRIVLQKSNRWLISANTLALVATLYVCAFVNFPYFIAAYNLNHGGAPTITKTSSWSNSVDAAYICSLGVHAFPAVETFVPRGPENPSRYATCFGKRLAKFLRDSDDWRSWSFRNQRLLNFLDIPH